MDTNDFYEDDEPIEEVKAAWTRSEKGVTSGRRGLDRRARSIVDRAVARFERPDEPAFRLTLVSGSTASGASVDETLPGAQSVDVTELEYSA